MKRALFLGTAAIALIIAGPAAFADEAEVEHAHSEVVNGQLNLGNVWSSLNVTASGIGGDVNGTSAAIGNSFSASLGGHAAVSNYQQTSGNVTANLSAALSDVEGDVNLTAAAVGNTASVHNHGGEPCPYENPEDCPELRAELALISGQVVEYVDPSATLNIVASGVGTLNGTAAAIGNSLSVQAVGPQNSVESYQEIGANTSSTVNASVSDAAGVNLTSAAVANTVSIDTLGN